MNAACETTPPSPKKRNASIAGFPNGVRPVKRRAAKACQTCRSRKVRCDVVESGPPCNNCRLDQIQCIVSDSRRKRRPRRSIGEDAGTEAGECKSISTCPGEVVNVSSSSDSSGSPACVDGPVDSSGGSPFELELDHHVPHMLYRTQGHRLSHEEQIRRLSLNSASSQYRVPLGQESNVASRQAKTMQACGPLSSPDCGVKELSSNISQILGHCSSTRDTTRLKELATMFIEKAKICINIGNVLTAQDPVHSQKVGCTPSMSQAVGERNEIFAPALTPPPEAWASCFLPQTSSLTQELSPSQKESPAASDDMDASSPSGTTAVPNDVNDMVISEAGFDNDFDEVFNMDMVADFLAADEDIVSCHDQDMQIGVDCEPFAALRGSELKSSFVQENAQGDPLTSLRISTQA